MYVGFKVEEVSVFEIFDWFMHLYICGFMVLILCIDEIEEMVIMVCCFDEIFGVVLFLW